MEKTLYNILSSHFIRSAVYPIIIIGAALLLIYFSTNYYINKNYVNHIEKDVKAHVQSLMLKESERIETQLMEISRLQTILQREHEQIFKHPNNFIIENKPTFKVAPNGVFYNGAPC